MSLYANSSDPRAAKLNKLFDSVIHGRQALTAKNNALFLEALCAAPDPTVCVEKIIASSDGLSCLQASMRFDFSPTFLNGRATDLLQYISAPALSSIGGGSVLRQVLLVIVDPPFFWNVFWKAFIKGQLQEKAQLSFTWLLLQLNMLPGDQAHPYRELAKDPVILDALLSSSNHDIRSTAEKIKHVIATCSSGAPVDLSEDGPGGRHDNDFVDFREIAILPTADELICKEDPFLRPSVVLNDPETRDNRLAIHLDNQFRLLREDMLYEMREELQIVLGEKKGRHRGSIIDGLTLEDIYYTLPGDRKCKWSLSFQCQSDFWQMKKVKPEDRKAYIQDNRKILRHQSMSCLIVDGEIVAFPMINRDEELLSRKPPVVVLQLEGQKSTTKTLLKLGAATHIRLVQIDTAVFAYEPVLTALQEKQTLPLFSELLLWTKGDIIAAPSGQPMAVVNAIRANPRQNLQNLLNTVKPIVLDKAQASSLLSGLTQRVSLIQGPPGTGKSFIGALLAKILHDFERQTILVVCYTNHALDQFLEDLLDIGIPESSMIRLGGKSTPRTEALTIQNQTKTCSSRLRKADWVEINSLKAKSEALSGSLAHDFQAYKSFNPQHHDILQHLEFEYPEYFEAFRLPESSDGMVKVGRKGRAVGLDYLLKQWMNGYDAGIFKDAPHVQDASEIWNLPIDSRRTNVVRWMQELMKDLVERFYITANDYNCCQIEIDRKFKGTEAALLRSKRIIGCTTTGAAKHREDISAARPGVLLVEEAGEILESHILTALGAETQQLILIGDHKQLRPKVNNYRLTVEKGDGYDLNKSLFERLVLNDYPHETLRIQHRMRPEISDLVRQLTYPELVDAASTHNRPNLRGVRDNVVFINHEKPEDDVSQISELRDMDAKSSKQNKFEVQMILKIVRYLAQQGYGTDRIVILTPYLGQLRSLQEALKNDNDPVLNDLDSYDLVRAGLMSSSAAKIGKRPIKLATIDNYQGEESDIVIASLTRSNTACDIGFMKAQERLTVLLSRARDAFIMIGNSHTFMNARKGGDVWSSLFNLLKRNNHIYDGLPVKCERHQDRKALLKCPEDFDEECPDGGCLEPCGVMLSCGLHFCPSKCHQLSDHSKMACEHIMCGKCPNNHQQQWKCKNSQPASCPKCDREKKIAEKKQQEEFALQEKRDEAQRLHVQEMAELDAQLAQRKAAMRDAQLAEDRKRAIQQKEKDLESFDRLAALASSIPSPTKAVSSVLSLFRKTSVPVHDQTKPEGSSQSQSSERTVASKRPSSPIKSAARDLWQWQKDVNGELNEAIDAIMEMTGLEAVKEQVLRIKDKVDTAIRQNTSLKGERFHVSMLGNPGTGKTTVARHYGKFLASVQVIPGDMFVETTGSRLSNDGVPGVKKLLEDVVKAGGGTIFVDEAYQLTSEHNIGGSQILDFLLAEMENNVGKLVFIFAGYNKEMEKFFEHNPGLTSRVPYALQFKDYEDNELMDMLEKSIDQMYKGEMKVEGEDGIKGLYGRIAVRRLGRGRGRNGFGNARALANMLAKIREHQAARLAKERRKGQKTDDFLLVKEDLIGPEPAKVMAESASWKKLQSLIGLGSVKKSVAELFQMVNTNYQRELLEKNPFEVSLNRVFFGSPGTGKTTVAKCYGQILAELGLISNGEVVIKNPADFIGAHLGQSESQTKAILATTVGKVLIIDEAYMLYGGSQSNAAADPYKTAVIDTIVAEVQSVPGEDRCVLLLGYKEQMESMFQNVNPGLARRFAIESAFHFLDYTDSELLQALDWKLKDQDLTATDGAKAVAIQVLSRARNRPNFGNIGEVENLLGAAKGRYQSRQASLPFEKRSPDAPFEPEDFDPQYNRNEHAASNLTKLFEDVVGCEDIIKKLRGWQTMARNMKNLGRDPREHIPTNFVFKGPPGTGKTTTARKMGQVYYDMGFLSSTEVVECSASDLVGQYVGHTGPKTRKLFEKALGRVLFIDEAYRLSEGHFAKEAMDELVGILTQDMFRGKLIVILAGYDREMNELMAINTGLSSRFPEEIVFNNIAPVQCLEVLRRKLEKESIRIDALEDPSSVEYTRMLEVLHELSLLSSWGNARDLETLSKQMVAIVFTIPSDVSAGDTGDQLKLAGKRAVECMGSMLAARRERVSNVRTRLDPDRNVGQMLSEPQGSPPLTSSTSNTSTKAPPPTPKPAVKQEFEQQPAETDSNDRDPGVADRVWHQLQIDKRLAKEAMTRSKERAELLAQQQQKTAQDEQAARMRQHELEKAAKKAKEEKERAELMRKREEERLRELAAKAERDRIVAALEAEKRKQQEEARIQTKLRQMGVCVAGFQWIKQISGYRCAGGSHFIDNGALGI